MYLKTLTVYTLVRGIDVIIIEKDNLYLYQSFFYSVALYIRVKFNRGIVWRVLKVQYFCIDNLIERERDKRETER